MMKLELHCKRAVSEKSKWLKYKARTVFEATF